MSLLINGMNMPKCCDDCPLYDSAGFCALDPTREFEDYNHKRPDDCTLGEIPTPHGRLIDADEFFNKAKEYLSNCQNDFYRVSLLQIFKNILDSTETRVEKENAQ